MGEILIELLPLSISAAVLPIWIIIVLFVLGGERGVSKATAFIGGALAVRLVQGVIFGFVIESAVQEYGEESANAIASTLLLIVGVLLLLGAMKKWRREEDPDAPPPAWKESLRRATPLKALGMGGLLMTLAMKQWVFTLSAIAVIEKGALSRGENVLVFLIFTLAAQSLMLLPVIAMLIAPSRANQWLAALESWLERNERVIMIGVSLVFGAWFFWKGIAGLIS